MVYLYLCKACQQNDHKNCELGHPAPPGVYGGSLCRCGCRGNPKWNEPMELSKELFKNMSSQTRTTHTFVKLELSNDAFKEIKEILLEAGYDHAFIDDGTIIDMNGLAVTAKQPLKAIFSLTLPSYML